MRSRPAWATCSTSSGGQGLSSWYLGSWHQGRGTGLRGQQALAPGSRLLRPLAWRPSQALSIQTYRCCFLAFARAAPRSLRTRRRARPLSRPSLLPCMRRSRTSSGHWRTSTGSHPAGQPSSEPRPASQPGPGPSRGEEPRPSRGRGAQAEQGRGAQAQPGQGAAGWPLAQTMAASPPQRADRVPPLFCCCIALSSFVPPLCKSIQSNAERALNKQGPVPGGAGAASCESQLSAPGARAGPPTQPAAGPQLEAPGWRKPEFGCGQVKAGCCSPLSTVMARDATGSRLLGRARACARSLVIRSVAHNRRGPLQRAASVSRGARAFAGREGGGGPTFSLRFWASPLLPRVSDPQTWRPRQRKPPQRRRVTLFERCSKRTADTLVVLHCRPRRRWALRRAIGVASENQ